jgi:hypothetical protein
MKYIKGYCKTNLDDYDCSIVNRFVALPRVGDLVRVLYKGYSTQLKIYSITHCIEATSGRDPFIEIELNKVVIL